MKNTNPFKINILPSQTSPLWILADLADVILLCVLIVVRTACFALLWSIILLPHTCSELSSAALLYSISFEILDVALRHLFIERIVNNRDSTTRIISVRMGSPVYMFYRAWDIINVCGLITVFVMLLVFCFLHPEWFLALLLPQPSAFTIFVGLVLAETAFRSTSSFLFFHKKSLSIEKMSTLSFNTWWLSGIIKDSFFVCFIFFAWGCFWFLLNWTFHFLGCHFLTRRFVGGFLTGHFAREFSHKFIIIFSLVAAMMCFRIVAPRLSLFADKVTDLLVTPRKYFRETYILVIAFLFLVGAMAISIRNLDARHSTSPPDVCIIPVAISCDEQ